MNPEPIGEYPPVDDRGQITIILRHAFPLGLGSFTGLPEALKEAGAAPYKRDGPEAEIHFLDTGHFALETHGPENAELIHDFLARKLG